MCGIIFRCKCGNCQCCTQIEECVDSFSSDIVLQDVEELPMCITMHLGFNSLCLDSLALHLAAAKLQIRKKEEYWQTSTQDR